MIDTVEPNERMLEIAKALKNGEPAPTVTVREFLNWFFGSQRRGRWVVSYIRDGLDKAGLRTIPDFESTYLDANMTFELATSPSSDNDVMAVEIAETVSIEEHTEVRVAKAVFADPTYRISKLGAANRRPTSVGPDSSIIEAATIMMANDFSQLPVMTSERDVKGIVSWKSIGSRLVLGKSPQWSRDAIEPHAEISSDASLFTAIPLIVEHEYVLVRGNDRRIVGIITTSDLSLQFQQLSEPFLLLGEIENHIRRIIGNKFAPNELSAAKDPSDASRTVDSPANLSFGEYKRLLEDPARWARLDLRIDRPVFIQLLERVRQIRNDVMHFDTDGIEDEALEDLRDFVRFLRTLQTVGAT
jgi:CBS domain-containing protein